MTNGTNIRETLWLVIMDNPLTPNKIQRLIRLAEDKSFNMSRRFLLDDEDLKRLATQKAATTAKSPVRYESSSGILDLDNIEAFGESAVGSMSLSKSSVFNPGEMTGRSTGTEESNTKLTVPPNEMCGRNSLAIEAITNEMNKQTDEVHDIMRHSIATNYSFHSKPNLTADEQSLVMREAPLPVMQTTVPHIQDNLSEINSSSLSTYFMKRCLDFKNILGKVDSPDKHYRPSISEVSYSTQMETPQKESKHDIDQSLDCVPVRQPRVPISTVPEMLKSLRVEPTNVESVMKHDITVSKDEKGKYVPSSSSYNDYVKKPGPLQSVQNYEDYIKKLNQSSLQLMSDETESSLSLSRIADYLGKHSNLNVSDILNMQHHKSEPKRMQPLKEMQMNMQESRNISNETQVTYLKDTNKGGTASSTSTMSTVLSMDRLKLNKENIACIPELVVTHCTMVENSDANSMKTEGRTTRSRSPSSKSHSTLNTVQENHLSFKSVDSPLHSSRGEPNESRPLSPQVEYKELDKSVDWQEVLRQKTARNKGLAKEHWAEITTSPVTGFVGARTAVSIIITTFTDSWLTGKFKFDSLPRDGQDLTVELPRLPILLSPGKSEHFTLHITSNVEMDTTLPFTLSLKDASIDYDTEQKGRLDVKIKLPTVQAMSSDGVNKLSFAPVLEESTTTKSLVLVSDCPEDLQLYLSIVEGDSIFAIKNVHEIKKSDVNKVLMHRQCSTEDAQTGKAKSKTLNKQLCRLTAGNAIRVSITFNAPKLLELQIPDDVVTLKGAFNVNLFGVDTVLQKIDLVGIVGTVDLVFKSPNSRLHISQDTTTVDVVNQGSAPASWVVKINSQHEGAVPFKVSPASSELPPGGVRTLTLCYTGPTDTVVEGILSVEETTTGKKTSLAIYGGCERPKLFPIKTNHVSMSWVRAGRKELSLKNSTQRKVHIRCQIVGEGFAIDAPGVDSKGNYVLSFGACECRPLPITFAPSSAVPQTATLHLVVDKTDSEFSRKIMLFGSSGGAALRWSGLVTYGGTALARAVGGAPVELALHNRAPVPAFAAATVRFNLQYMCVSAWASLAGARRVVRARGSHAVALRVPWERVRRRAAPAPAAAAASSLATLTVITGAEITRRRILKILRDESNGELNTSLLPDHLKILADKFEGEDPAMDNYLANFKETKSSLNELIGGIQELTAQIDLPQDFLDETTVVIGDETVLEHHTICD